MSINGSTQLSDLLPKGLSLKLDEGQVAVVKVEHSLTGPMESVFRQFINFLGLDENDQNLKDTPMRAAKMWTEWAQGGSVKLTAFDSPVSTPVLLRGHETVSVCPHHLLPFKLTVQLGYEPAGKVVGLSKLPRLVDLVSKSFILQEHLPEVLCEILDRLLKPKGLYCRVEGEHGCMRLRGVRTPGTVISEAERGWTDRIRRLA